MVRLPHTVTAHGNPFIFNGSGLFNGDGDYLSIPNSEDWNFGADDFTVDFKVRFKVLPADGQDEVFFTRYPTENMNGYFVLLNDGFGYYHWMFVVDGTSILLEAVEPATNLSTNTRYHVALTRSGNEFRVFRDGIQIGSTYTSSYAIPAFDSDFFIAGRPNGEYLNGYLDEFRVSKSIARWTSNFTPPTSPYVSDQYAILLLHMDGADGSSLFLDSSQPSGPCGEGGKDGAFLCWNANMASWVSRSLTVGAIHIGAFAEGSVLFCGKSVIEEDADNFVYDKVNKQLGIGLGSTPTAGLDLAASIAAAASLRIRTGVAPTSPNEGDVWVDSTRKALMTYLNGIIGAHPRCLFTSWGHGTCGNTPNETSIIGTGVGSTALPANYLVSGKKLRIRVAGAYSTKASGAGTLVIKVKLVTDNGTTIILALPATTVTDNVAKRPFTIEAMITGRVAGATGNVIGQGTLFMANAAAQTGVFYTLPNQGSDPLQVITLDTTATQAIDVTATWGTSDAGNTISSTNVSIEAMN